MLVVPAIPASALTAYQLPHWAGRSVYVVDRTGSPTLHAALQRGAASWNSRLREVHLEVVQDQYVGWCSDGNYEIEVCAGIPAYGAIGYTLDTWDGANLLTGSSILLDPIEGAADSVTCHELGHALGIIHTSPQGHDQYGHAPDWAWMQTCMTPSSPSAPFPGPVDVAAVDSAHRGG